MHAPGRRRDENGSDELVQHRQPQGDPSHHRRDAEQDLHSECRMDCDRCAPVERPVAKDDVLAGRQTSPHAEETDEALKPEKP